MSVCQGIGVEEIVVHHDVRNTPDGIGAGTRRRLNRERRLVANHTVRVDGSVEEVAASSNRAIPEVGIRRVETGPRLIEGGQDIRAVRVSRAGVELDDVAALVEVLRPDQVEDPLGFLPIIVLPRRVTPAGVRKDEGGGEILVPVRRAAGR